MVLRNSSSFMPKRNGSSVSATGHATQFTSPSSTRLRPNRAHRSHLPIHGAHPPSLTQPCRAAAVAAHGPPRERPPSHFEQVLLLSSPSSTLVCTWVGTKQRTASFCLLPRFSPAATRTPDATDGVWPFHVPPFTSYACGIFKHLNTPPLRLRPIRGRAFE